VKLSIYKNWVTRLQTVFVQDQTMVVKRNWENSLGLIPGK